MPVAIAYALWSGLGTVLVTILSWLTARQAIEFTHVIASGAAQRRLRESYFVAILTPATKLLRKMVAEL